MKHDRYYKSPGGTYFRAKWIKRREHFRVWWLWSGGEFRASKTYTEDDLLNCRKLKNKPTPSRLRAVELERAEQLKREVAA